MKKLVSDLMVDYLERRGVEYIFGLCGHTVIGFLDALSRSEKIKYISVRHEQIAATAADGYARVKHKAAVVLSHLGPGHHQHRNRHCQCGVRFHPGSCSSRATCRAIISASIPIRK